MSRTSCAISTSSSPQCVDYVQMDVCCQGGFAMARRLFGEIAHEGLKFAFHSWGTALEVLAAAHLGICWPEMVVEWLEYPCYSNEVRAGMYPFPLAEEIFKEPLEIRSRRSDRAPQARPRRRDQRIHHRPLSLDSRSLVLLPHRFARRNSRRYLRSQREVGRQSGRMKARQFRYYDLLVHIFVVILLISNLVGQKITAIGPFRVSGAQLLFPITYIFGDVFTEVYGYGASRRAIWIGFFASALLSLMCVCSRCGCRRRPDWPNQEAFATVFYFVPRMIAASLIAYLVRRVRQLFRARRNEALDRRQISLDAHRRLHRRRPGRRHRRLHDAGLRRVAHALPHRSVNLLGISVQGGLRSAGHPATYAIVNFLKRNEGVDTFDRAPASTPSVTPSKSRD